MTAPPTPTPRWQPANRLEAERLDKLERLRALGHEPFPARVTRTHTAAAAIAAYEQHTNTGGADDHTPTVTVAGRVRRVNLKGKVGFLHLEDGTGRVQLFVRADAVGEAAYALLKDKLVELDDFVQATGTMMRTQAGEVSVGVTSLHVLAKALSPLPVVKQQVQDDGTVREFGEFSNIEARYRQRYTDLAVNHAVREVFVRRAATLRALRTFLDAEGFLEVETPVLQPVYGGAAARPFTTHHNQLRQDLYLRISFELYLKRLLVGGLDAVYEIGRDFRNEGVSFKHNPEFTQLEFYKAYIDYHGVMDIVERMVAFVAEQVTGSTTVSYQGHTLQLAPPWARLRLQDAIRARTGLDYAAYPDAPSLEAAIRARGDTVASGQTWGALVDYLLSTYVEPTLTQPTFLLDYPRDISPFAKAVADDPLHVERFELFMAGLEMGNAFTELNDPLDQEQRFLDMAALYRDDDDEATPLDEDYLRAMRHGMPPNGGFGIGVDRLVMLLTDQRNIRDVLLYPHLREAK